jgi:hypothetical protein
MPSFMAIGKCSGDAQHHLTFGPLAPVSGMRAGRRAPSPASAWGISDIPISSNGMNDAAPAA